MGRFSRSDTDSNRTSASASFALGDPERLAELHATGLLDSASADTFDRITRLAQRTLEVPVATVSLLDEDFQHFLSPVGMTGAWAEDGQAPVSESFCQYAVATGEAMVVDDARSTRLIREDHPVLEHGVIAYAGQPLETSDGHVLGTLCVIDHEPRRWSETEIELLAELAGLATLQIDSRAREKRVRRIETLVRQLQDPLETLGDAIRSLASLAERSSDVRVGRLAALVRSRFGSVESITTDLRESVTASRRAPERRWIDLNERLQRAVRLATIGLSSDDVRLYIHDEVEVEGYDSDLLERGLSYLVVTALHHRDGSDPVEIVLEDRDGSAWLDVRVGGTGMPVAEVSRIISKLSSVLSDEEEGAGTTTAAVRLRGRTATAESGPVRASTGPDGTHVTLALPARRP